MGTDSTCRLTAAAPTNTGSAPSRFAFAVWASPATLNPRDSVANGSRERRWINSNTSTGVALRMQRPDEREVPRGTPKAEGVGGRIGFRRTGLRPPVMRTLHRDQQASDVSAAVERRGIGSNRGSLGGASVVSLRTGHLPFREPSSERSQEAGLGCLPAGDYVRWKDCLLHGRFRPASERLGSIWEF